MNLPRSHQGYALATVLIFSALLCMTAAVLLRYSGTEFRLNQRNQLRFQAKNASEAMLEYGSAELMQRLNKNVNFSTGELRANPLTTQTTRKTTLYASGSSTYNNVASTGLSFWASQYTEPTKRFIDPGDPGNAYDPLRGQTVRSQTLRLLASAASSVPGLSETQYATQSIEIRDVFLFNYAIYYNITMEFHPGPNMTISGPVHSNADSYLTSTSGKTLKFLDTFTTAGKFTAGAAAAGRPTGTDVYFTTGLDLNVDGVQDTIAINDSSIKNASGASLGTYVDSNLATRSAGNSFSQISSQTWKGNVQDSSMGIIPQSIPAVTAGNVAEAHTMIEPPDTSFSANAQLEAQKYANKAGLYVFQGANSGGTPPAPVAFKSSTDANTYRALSTAALRTAWVSANPAKIVQLPAGVVNTNRRMNDFREGATVNTIDVDLGKLRTAVNSTTANAATNLKAWDTTTSTYKDWNLDASTGGWNGQVYVEVERPTAGYNTTSDVGSVGTGTGTRTSVRLINGNQVPNRKEATGGATAPDGFTLATNAPVYICGNLNSQGVNAGTRGGTAVGTEAVSTVGTAKDGEAPVSIAADAVNILSNAWWNAGSGKPVGDDTSSNTTRPGATSTEIAAAIVTGNVPTNSGGTSYSGGVENFPRFLEDWSGDTFRYRGSMVALFNSTVATGAWSSARYSAPDRVWGFSDMFKSGRQPPGTPMIRTFRRVTYGDLTATQFNALLNNTTLGFTAM
jgi:hypothetical protein